MTSNWSTRTSSTIYYLSPVFGTSDGKRLRAVGIGGTILEATQQGVAPFIREAHLKSALEIDVAHGPGESIE